MKTKLVMNLDVQQTRDDEVVYFVTWPDNAP
jgi:hypothetical protein